MKPIFSKLDVAIHEAGHAVCNHFFGRGTEKIVLSFQPESNEWHGETHAVPPKVPAQIRTNFSFGSAVPVEPPDFSPLAAECVIAAAGYFAQVVKTGRDSSPDVLLSVTQNWVSLLGWLFDKRLVTEKPEFAMAVTTGGELACTAIPPRAFSSGDQRSYCSVWDVFEKRYPKQFCSVEHIAFEQKLIDDMGRFLGFLNRAETWQVVCEIAGILVELQDSPAVLDGATLGQVLGKLHVT